MRTPSSSAEYRTRLRLGLLLGGFLAVLFSLAFTAPFFDGGASASGWVTRASSWPGDVDCRLCHGRRGRLLDQGVHAKAAARGCTSCHRKTEKHLESRGVERAGHPTKESVPDQVALCSSCHDPVAADFHCHERMAKVDASCLDCHSFHAGSAKGSQAPEERTHSHGIDIQSSKPRLDADGVSVWGAVAFGVRGVVGAGRQFESDINLPPGPRLVHGRVEGLTRDPDATVDHLLLSARGIGDPMTSARLELGKRKLWAFRASGRQFEDHFDPSTDLHDMFSRRRSGSLEFELTPRKDLIFEVAYDRFDRREDRGLTRYREISNELFNDAKGNVQWSADVVRLHAGARFTKGSLDFHQSLRWWRDHDERNLFAANQLLDNREAFDARSTAFTWASKLIGSARVLDDRLHLDAEIFLAASDRSFDDRSTASGVDAVHDPYSSTTRNLGDAQGFYLRVEVGALWEISDHWATSLRLRGRFDDEDVAGTARTALLSPPAGVPQFSEVRGDYNTSIRGFDTEALVRYRPMKELTLSLGAVTRYETLEFERDRKDVEPGSFGLLFSIDARPIDELRIRGKFRGFTTNDPYTLITPNRRGLFGVDLSWTPCDLLRLDLGASRSSTRFSGSDSRGDVNSLNATLTLGQTTDPWSGRLSYVRHEFDTTIQTRARLSGFPVPYDARFLARSSLASGSLQWRPLKSLSFAAGGDLSNTTGGNDAQFLRGWIQGSYHFDEDMRFILRGSWYDFDGTEADRDDFSATVIEASLEIRF